MCCKLMCRTPFLVMLRYSSQEQLKRVVPRAPMMNVHVPIGAHLGRTRADIPTFPTSCCVCCPAEGSRKMWLSVAAAAGECFHTSRLRVGVACVHVSICCGARCRGYMEG